MSSQVSSPSATGKCNLKRDPITGFTGPANVQTTVAIKDPTGQAMFQTIDYGTKNLGKNVSSVTFTILQGQNDLTYAYVAPIAGDEIRLVDPCGTELASFAADPGNPFARHIIVGKSV